MTWLSRLLTQNPSSLHHRASGSRTRNRGVRPSLYLESLEKRVVLSNVAVTYAAGALTIVGDGLNNAISITENSVAAGGTVVVGSLNTRTTINSFPSSISFTSPGPVSSIAVSYTPGISGQSNVEKIVMTGPGKSVATTVHNVSITLPAGAPGTMGPALGLSVQGVDNANGSFTVTSFGNINGPGTTPTQIANPTLITGAATIDNSQFSSLNITQNSNNCQASVELGSDTITGAVVVSLGSGGPDSIVLDALGTPAVRDKFGSTTLSEGNFSGTAAAHDTISVSGTTAKDMTITQGSGNFDTITVNGLILSNISGPGLTTGQGNGNNDTTTINNVTIQNGLTIPDSPTLPTALASITVTQGNGNTDTATITNSTVPGNITITQGNGNMDLAQVMGSTATGLVDVIGGIPVDSLGVLTIFQGNGSGDIANMDKTATSPDDVFNNVFITQGTPPAPGQGGNNGDTVNVNDSLIASNLTILQGSAAAFGNYFVNIGTTSFVSVGGATTITQTGEDNTVTLGGAGSASGVDFYTNTLDINTGTVGLALGGGLVTAMNTTDNNGSVGAFSVTGGNPVGFITNLYIDLGGNSGITVDPGSYFTE